MKPRKYVKGVERVGQEATSNDFLSSGPVH